MEGIEKSKILLFTETVQRIPMKTKYVVNIKDHLVKTFEKDWQQSEVTK